MTRDMELARKILMKIEEKSSPSATPLHVDGYDMETVAQHCKLLYEYGLVGSYNPQYAANSLYTFSAGPLTWEGYDYLDKIRNENTWTKVKTWIKEKGLPFTIEVIRDALIALI